MKKLVILIMMIILMGCGDKEITDIVHDAVQNALTAEPSVKQICTDPELVKIQSNGEENIIEVKTEEEE